MIALDAPLTAGARQAQVLWLRAGIRSESADWLPEEVPVALEFNGVSHAVMLATPMDQEDFALGFGLSEGIFDRQANLYDCEVDACAEGLTVHLEVSSRSFARLRAMRRTLAGRTGCGVCGTESLAQVLRPLPRVVAGQVIHSTAITRAMDGLRDRQLLGQATGATHAAAWCDGTGDIRLVREDVGRHNALDKLIGALARAGIDAGSGFMAVTSRASVEMVHKTVVARVPLLAAVSAPTLLAVNTAKQAGMCLGGLARQGNLAVYAHPQHLSLSDGTDR